MINGNDTDQKYYETFVTQREFAPIANEVKYLGIKDGKIDIMFETMSKNIDSMATNMGKITDVVTNLDLNDKINYKIRSFVVKVSICTVSLIATMITAHFIDIIRLIEKYIG